MSWLRFGSGGLGSVTGSGIRARRLNLTGKLSLTQQLTEYLKYAKANGYAVHLFVRQGEGTQLSGPLQALVDSG